MDKKFFYVVTSQGLMKFDMRNCISSTLEWLEKENILYWAKIGWHERDILVDYLEAIYTILPTFDAEYERSKKL